MRFGGSSSLLQLIKVKPKEKKKVIVAIDAGHGGEDPGAIGKYGTKEKKIVLQITKRLKKLINSEKPHVTLYKPQNQKECDKVVELILTNKLN